jgi:hypothetical protein
MGKVAGSIPALTTIPSPGALFSIAYARFVSHVAPPPPKAGIWGLFIKHVAALPSGGLRLVRAAPLVLPTMRLDRPENFEPYNYSFSVNNSESSHGLFKNE